MGCVAVARLRCQIVVAGQQVTADCLLQGLARPSARRQPPSQGEKNHAHAHQPPPEHPLHRLASIPQHGGYAQWTMHHLHRGHRITLHTAHDDTHTRTPHTASHHTHILSVPSTGYIHPIIIRRVHTHTPLLTVRHQQRTMNISQLELQRMLPVHVRGAYAYVHVCTSQD